MADVQPSTTRVLTEEQAGRSRSWPRSLRSATSAWPFSTA